MSNATYDELWKKVHESLEETVQIDLTTQNSKPQKDRKKARFTSSELYVKYVVICNKLNKCYDQMIQPQKRILLKKLLDSVLGRVLELKHELVDIDLSECNYFDDILLKNNLTPRATEIEIPKYFRRASENNYRGKIKFIEDTLRNIGELGAKITPRKMTENEAIRLIQAHERARQGRLRFQFMKEIRAMNERSSHRLESSEKDETDEIKAALKIQKLWRGYTTRRKIRKTRIEEMLLIGMIPATQDISSARKRVQKIEEMRHQKQREHEKLYKESLIEIRENLQKNKGTLIEENIRLEIRKWIEDCFLQTGKIPELPSVESGGSKMIFNAQGDGSSISKSTGTSSKESKRSKRSSKDKKEVEIEHSEEELEYGLKFAASNFLPEIIQANHDYLNVWKNKDESSNPAQLPYKDMVEMENTKSIENEIRIHVDHEMRGDIETLQAALDHDKGFKGRRSKKSPKRLRRSGKKNKKKKEKDLTPDRSTESLFDELVTNGIVKLYPEVRLSSYKGEKSYANSDLCNMDKNTTPSLGDIRQLVAEYCILPLGNEAIKELTPLVRSVLIVGPKGSGKKMLVHAICTELGAMLFDLTPANIAGKYPGKSGLIMLLHLVSKVSKLLQPSVIYIDNAEKTFMKKVPKTDKTDPKRLKKDLGKLVKGILNEDKVILIGTSNTPWECDQKLLYQVYDKVIFIPRPDYGTMSEIWKSLLLKYSSIDRQFDTSGMAKICDGFTIGSVISTINKVMTTKRMVQLSTQPLTHAELINALSLHDPVFREEEQAFANWFSKTPTCRKKQKVIEFELRKSEEANEKKKKGKKR